MQRFQSWFAAAAAHVSVAVLLLVVPVDVMSHA
jgi:hypothetical protein